MFDIKEIIQAVGYTGVSIIVFAESGFLLGFFLPGDSLLITAGLLSAGGLMNVWLLAPLAIVSAILGDSFGYTTGRILGPRVFSKEESRFFRKSYVESTEQFFKKHGVFTIILARFIPIIRTFAPIMAGVGKMKYRTFLSFNIIGGFLWAGGLILISYFAGSLIPNLDKYIQYIVGVVIILSLLPLVKHYYNPKK